MSHLGTRFSRASGLALTLAWAVLAAPAAASRSLLTREEALALAYPGAAVTAERIFLTAEQQKRIAANARVPIASALIGRYVARKDGQIAGRAYVDTHTIRTKKETLLVSLDAGGKVKRVDVTAFLEPPEYEAPQAFLNQYGGRSLTDDLQLQRAIRPVAGASLTSRSVTEAVRRVLAIDAVLR
jgi:hypothetical protein